MVHYRPFFQVATETPNDGGPDEPAIHINDVYDAGIINTATWTPDYNNGPAQYVFFQADCEIQLPTNINTGEAETFHLYLDTNGYTISFDAHGYALPNGIGDPLNLTHWNGIINHQGVLSGTFLPDMVLGGVNITF